MGRQGTTSGKGGRNYHLNWTNDANGAHFGPWIIEFYATGPMPYRVLKNNYPILRAHGACTGFVRFKTIENAKRWVEKRVHTSFR
jgi:hypothetical protein